MKIWLSVFVIFFFYTAFKGHSQNPSPLKVHPITGECNEETIDFTIAGALPLSVGYFYPSSQSKKKQRAVIVGSSTLYPFLSPFFPDRKCYPLIVKAAAPHKEERLPCGLIIHCAYTQEQNSTFLQSITAYNSDKSQVLGFIEFSYLKGKGNAITTIQLRGSDNTIAYIPPSPSSQPKEGITIEYNSEGKVISQQALVNGQKSSIAHYIYQDKATIAFDAQNNKTIYYYNDSQKITAIETYNSDSLSHRERFSWDPTTGNLLSKTVESASGSILQTFECQYHKNNKPSLLKIGNHAQWHTSIFSEEGLKLMETDEEGNGVCYHYVPHTDLLASRLVYNKQMICKRIFYFYDDCALCIKTIVDDGNSENPNHLQGVSFREITTITPKRSLPCFGLPEVIEKKTIDSSGRETLLNKTVYHYTPCGKDLYKKNPLPPTTKRPTSFLDIIDAPKDYFSFEEDFDNKSRNYSLNHDFGFSFPEPPLGIYLFGNGITTTFADVQEKAYAISLCSGYNTKGTYNATHSLPIDAYEAFINLTSHSLTTPIYYYHQQWNSYFDNDLSGAPLWQACHSQGAVHVRNALETYPKERRERIIVAAFAPLAYISPLLCRHVNHYVCPLDPVPYFDFQAKCACEGTITYVSYFSHEEWTCHNFLHPIYQPYLQTEIYQYQELLKAYT